MMLKEVTKGIKKVKTKLAIQTLLFSSKALSNYDKKNIDGLIKIYKKINPSIIYLGTSYRPADGLKSLSEKKLKEIALKIGKRTGIPVKHYKKTKSKKIKQDISEDGLKDELLKLIKRRPCTKDDLITRFGEDNLTKTLKKLFEEKTLTKKGEFYKAR